MEVYESRDELIRTLETYNNKDYVETKFAKWLEVYPDIINIMLNDKYNKLFNNAIRKNMDKILKKLIEENSLYRISDLRYKYENEVVENIDVIFDAILDSELICLDYLCELVKLDSSKKIILEKQDKILEKIIAFNDYRFLTDYTYNLLFLLGSLLYFSDEFIEKNKSIIQNILITLFNNIEPTCYNDSDLLFLFKIITLGSRKHKFINDFFNKHIEFIVVIFSNKKLSLLK